MNSNIQETIEKVTNALLEQKREAIPEKDAQSVTLLPVGSNKSQAETEQVPFSSIAQGDDDIIIPEIMDEESEVETAVSRPRHTYHPPVLLFTEEQDNYGPQRTLDDLLGLKDDDKTPAERKYGFPVVVEAGESSTKCCFNQRAIAGTFHMDVHQTLMIYISELKKFFLYNHSTGLWKHFSDVKLQKDIAEYIKRITPEDFWTKVTSALIASAFNLLKQIAAQDDVFKKTQNFIHVENGILYYKDGKFKIKEFSPFHLSRNRTEIPYQEDAECPQFIEKLLEPALSNEDRELIQKYAGQCLLGRNLSQKLLLLRGTPGGGKSTLVNVIRAIIGSINTGELRPSHLTQRFELTRYNGKTLLIGPDVKSKFLNTAGASVIKALVGNDYMEGEVKGGNAVVSMVGDFNIMITTNSRLLVKLESDAGAWKRRLLIVDYNCPPPEVVIPDFDKKLIEEEGAGILRWCIEGAEKLLAELSQGDGRLRLTEEQEKRIDDLLNESDSIRSFANEWIDTDSESTITTHEALTAYNRYCQEKGWETQGMRHFWRELPDIMMEFYHVTPRTDVKRYERNQRGYYGVKLVTS